MHGRARDVAPDGVEQHLVPEARHGLARDRPSGRSAPPRSTCAAPATGAAARSELASRARAGRDVDHATACDPPPHPDRRMVRRWWRLPTSRASAVREPRLGPRLASADGRSGLSRERRVDCRPACTLGRSVAARHGRRHWRGRRWPPPDKGDASRCRTSSTRPSRPAWSTSTTAAGSTSSAAAWPPSTATRTAASTSTSPAALNRRPCSGTDSPVGGALRFERIDERRDGPDGGHGRLPAGHRLGRPPRPRGAAPRRERAAARRRRLRLRARQRGLGLRWRG